MWREFSRPESLLGVLQAPLSLLPVVMVSSMSGATIAQRKLQADEISTLASGIRAYHADKVIALLQAADGQAQLQERSIFASVVDDLSSASRSLTGASRIPR